MVGGDTMKRLLLAVTMLLALPGFAQAYNYWSITASTSPASLSNAITPPSDAASFLTTGGLTNVISATVNSADFTVDPAPTGYLLSYVQVDGATVQPVAGSTYRVNHASRVNHTINAYYQVQTYLITTIPGANGLIDPSARVAYGSSKTISMTANTGYQIDTVAVTGAPAATGYSGLTSFAYTFDNVQSDKTIQATYKIIPVLIARIATSTQTILVNSTLSIDAGSSTATVPVLYSWTVVDPVTGLPATGATVTTGGSTAQFTPSVLGTFRVLLTLTSPLTASSTASLDIPVISQSMYRSSNCAACHTARNPDIIAGYDASPHAASIGLEVSCYSCHYQGDAVQHPGVIHPVGICVTCHLGADGKVAGHPIAIGSASCVSCHDPHSTTPFVAAIQGPPHYNNVTGGSYPASYLSSRADCADCHYDSPENQAIRQQWYSSGHAQVAARPFTGYDFKTLDGCVQCHTTTGFIAYSSGRATSAWGAASDKTKEIISCRGCHTDISTGELRGNRPVQPYAGESYRNPDLGAASNLCATCHSGTASGRSIKAQAAAGADFGNLPFTGSHSSAAAGILFTSIGYQFGFRNYSNGWHFKHDRIGVNHFKAYGFDTGSDGPCAGCHMSSPGKHSFSPLAKDASGAVSAIVSSSCAGCHSGPAYLDAARTNSRISKFAASLLALQKMLERKGIFYADQAPYFFKSAGNVSAGNAVTNWGNADTMGAAFNFNLLQHEPGAYAHNMTYSKRLIYDSIDFLDNGALDDSVSSAIDSLATLAADQKASAKGYLVPKGTRP